MWLYATGQLHEEEGQGPEGRHINTIWELLELARVDLHSQCTVLIPVHSFKPEHWTLLQMDRSRTDPVQEPAAWTVK